MATLNDELNLLSKLDELRLTAKKLRDRGYKALEKLEYELGPSNDNIEASTGRVTSGNAEFDEKWASSEDEVEIALLVKVQNNKTLGSPSSKAASTLVARLTNITLEKLFHYHEQPEKVPVLVAARAMQALVETSAYTFSPASLLCYYRIVRELYSVDSPDWTVGGARAGKGGGASAFITGECIRAVFAFERTLRRTANFFHRTFELYKNMERFAKFHEPYSAWCDAEIERLGLDWYISTDQHLGEIGLRLDAMPKLTGRLNRDFVNDYLSKLPRSLSLSMQRGKRNIDNAIKMIDAFRKEEYKKASANTAKPSEYDRYLRAESAHNIALHVVKKALGEANSSIELLNYEQGSSNLNVLRELQSQFEKIADDVHNVLEPAKRYVRTVLYRELSAPPTNPPDHGELVFAAASYGATIGWKPNEMLNRAYSMLSDSLSERGLFSTDRPFHSTSNGYRLYPIAFELSRGFAQLLQKVDGPINPQLVQRMLNVFNDNLISIDRNNAEDGPCAWHFENPPRPKRPSFWVSALAVMALDRIVRMLDRKINTIILQHFTVKYPSQSDDSLKLDSLIYPDYGLRSLIKEEPSVAVRLEQMRSHIMQTHLPGEYGAKVYSCIFYGPPGTGKTTLLEALAQSSRVPLVSLSPGDLTVQGQEAIENRARAIFEALSMLTKVVILFDEFEDVLHSRYLGKKISQNQTDDGNSNKPDVSMFAFLRTGMLPKLKKLHDASKNQSVAYCLCTNLYEELDWAATRSGRFDYHIGIYKPDLLSRAGSFRNELLRYRPDFEWKQENEIRFAEIIKDTAGLSVQDLAVEKFKRPDVDPPISKTTFAYVLEGGERPPKPKEDKPPHEDNRRPDKDEEKLKQWETMLPHQSKSNLSEALAIALKNPPS
jgi:hypothetical protein